MNKKLDTQKETLKASISHWEENAQASEISDIKLGVDNCACCVKYISAGACKGCPVAQYTGWTFCKTTPYDVLGFDDILGEGGKANPAYTWLPVADWVSRAKEELKFLQKVLLWLEAGKPEDRG